MDIEQYCDDTIETAIYPNVDNDDGLVYVMLGLIGEMGEVIAEFDNQMVSSAPEAIDDPIFHLFNVMSDIGEVAEALKKALRDGEGVLDGERLKRAQRGLLGLRVCVDYLGASLEGPVIELDPPTVRLNEFDSLKASHELGDVCWYMARAFDHLNVDWSTELAYNRDKVCRRLVEGKTKGDGSDR